MKESCIVYAVKLKRTDGSEFLASAGSALVQTFRLRRDAVKYRDELREHLSGRHKGRVVKVRVTVEELPAKGGA